MAYKTSSGLEVETITMNTVDEKVVLQSDMGKRKRVEKGKKVWDALKKRFIVLSKIRKQRKHGKS